MRARWLDHGNTLAIDGCHQDGAGGGLRRTLPIKSIEVLRRVGQDLFQAAFGDGHAREVGYGLDRIQKRILHGGFNQAALEFVGERAGGQNQRLIQREDTGYATLGIAHADKLDGSKDGGKRAGAQPSVRVGHLAALLPEVQCGSHISVAALLQVCLKKQALHLAALGLLLTLDLVEGEVQSAAGCQPRLEKSELDSGRCDAGERKSCGCHSPTVVLP